VKIYEIASHLKNLKISTGIVTNGLTLDSDTISRLKDSGVSNIAISIDGLESTHDYIRGRRGIFKEVIKGTKRAVEANIPTIVITTVTELNINELPSLFEILISIDVRKWRPQPVIPVGRVESSSELKMKESTYLQLINFVQDWGPKAVEAGMELHRADGLGYYYESDFYRVPWYGYPAGLVSCGITSNGKVKGCLSLPDKFIEGDLRKKTLWDIWFHPNSFVYTRQFSTKLLGPNCNPCQRAEQCRGGCSAMSYGSTGRFHNDPYCYLSIKSRRKNRKKSF